MSYAQIVTRAGALQLLLRQMAAPAALPTIAPQLTDPGVAAQAIAGTPVISGGAIVSVPVLSGGTGYTAAPAVTISGGGGSGATVTASVSGQGVSKLTVTAGGTGFTSTPYISIAASNLTGITDAFMLEEAGSRQTVFNRVRLVFFGAGTDGGTQNIKLVGWNRVSFFDTPGLWVPTTVAYLLGTIGTTAGPTGSLTPPLSTHAFFKTLAVNSSIAVPDATLWTGDLGIATIQLSLAGFQRLSLIPGTNASGSVTLVNGLIAGYGLG